MNKHRVLIVRNDHIHRCPKLLLVVHEKRDVLFFHALTPEINPQLLDDTFRMVGPLVTGPSTVFVSPSLDMIGYPLGMVISGD